MSFAIKLALLSGVAVSAFAPIHLRPLSRRSIMMRSSELSDAEMEEMATRAEGEELAKKLRSNMYNENGVAYAPWMVNQIDEEAYEAAKMMRKQRKMKDKADAVEEQGAYFNTDLQADELSGLGLKIKFVNDEVELSWKTGGESNNFGYTIQKRAAGKAEWVTIASYEDMAPLQSKGANGGDYFFIDPTTEEGDWIYRVVDVEKGGKNTVLCQALVEVQSQGEKTLQLAAAVTIGAIFAGLVAAGIAFDPLR